MLWTSPFFRRLCCSADLLCPLVRTHAPTHARTQTHRTAPQAQGVAVKGASRDGAHLLRLVNFVHNSCLSKVRNPYPYLPFRACFVFTSVVHFSLLAGQAGTRDSSQAILPKRPPIHAPVPFMSYIRAVIFSSILFLFCLCFACVDDVHSTRTSARTCRALRRPSSSPFWTATRSWCRARAASSPSAGNTSRRVRA